MKFKKTIGILGGMGPVASLNMYQDIIKTCQDKYNCQQDFDFPKMIIYNLPLVGFDETGIVDHGLVKEQLIEAAKKLELAGADFLIIACNTVHVFQKDIASSIGIPLLSMLEETASEIKQEKFGKVGVLGSASTKELGLYDKALSELGVKALGLIALEQSIVDKIILNVMTSQQSQVDKEKLKNIIEHLVSQGAEAIVLGCTELPLAISQQDLEIKIFDSTKIIVERALEHAK